MSRSAADGRLASIASVLRYAVEGGVRSLKLKTLKALLDHITQMIMLSGGGLCAPLALDYAKCLRLAVSYQPHAEHLPPKEWGQVVSFCVESLKSIQNELSEEDVVPGASSTPVAGSMSYKSSRSQYKESNGSQGVRSLYKQVTEELLGSLSVLTVTPNAPLGLIAPKLLWALIDYLKVNPTAGTPQQEAFASINHVLAWSTTEDTTLTHKATINIVRLIRHLWPQKSSSLKHDMLITLLHLQPYIGHVMQREDAFTLRSELSSLLDVLRAEYGSRSQERDQLRVDDLSFDVSPTSPDTDGPEVVSVPIFSLQCADIDAEAKWTLVYMLAYFSSLMAAPATAQGSSDEDSEDISRRPRKRQRLSDVWSDTLALCATGPTSTRICALQTVTFFAQETGLVAKQIAQAVDSLSIVCGHDNASLASWALLALSSCASQCSATDTTLVARWNALWQIANRAISTGSTCRAACHLLRIIMELQLGAPESTLELIQSSTVSVDMNGPSILTDSAMSFLYDALRKTQQLLPGSVNSLSEGITGWLVRKFLPSKFEDRTLATKQHTHRPQNFLNLLTACLDHDVRHDERTDFPIWDKVAQAWLGCLSQRDLVSYLLLSPERIDVTNKKLFTRLNRAYSGTFAGRAPCESIVLAYIIPELRRTVEVWNRWRYERPQGISTDMLRSLCQSCCVATCLAQCHTFRDQRKQDQAKKAASDLVDSIAVFAGTSSCTQEKLDVILLTFAQLCTGPLSDHRNQRSSVRKCEELLFQKLHAVLTVRKEKGLNSGVMDDDGMDLDDGYDSQDSRHGKLGGALHEPRSIQSAAFSRTAAISNIEIYAAAMSALNDMQQDGDKLTSASNVFANYIETCSEITICFGSKTLSFLPKLGLILQPDDAYRVMEYCIANFLESYPYERCETAMSSAMDVMSSLMSSWTDTPNLRSRGLGIDMYEWYLQVLSAKRLSINLQKRFATLLLRLCLIDADYPREEQVQSARTSLFQLLQHGSIQAQHHLSGQIPELFGLYILSRHEDVFDDLQASISAEVDWVEGIAMRLHVLGGLASSWHTLLRTCVFYIFETAGRLKEIAAGYAVRCIRSVTESLGFDSAQKLFQLFAPQLLYTWLDGGNTLSSLPFSVFQYSSLEELLERNQVEITAQLFMRGKEDGLHLLTKGLKLSAKDLALRAFPKTLAYTISWDAATKPEKAGEVTSEGRLRSVLGGKQEISSLARKYFPTIMGLFFLSTQPDDAQDLWVTKKDEYKSAAKALSAMKSYSSSTRTLTVSQQPSLKPRYLSDQIGRLCRRAGSDPLAPWNAATFSLAVRMHLDAINDALGPLHKCLMLRKIRILISLSGDVALSGFPLELLLHSLSPFLVDSECADDALGMLQYLLQQGMPYLKQEGIAFAHGTILVMILLMQKHAVAKQESTTQESQYRITVQKMAAFRDWLVAYLQECPPLTSRRHATTSSLIVQALSGLQMPGNGRKDTPESSLLLLLLEQQRQSSALIPRQHSKEALRLLSKDFEMPASVADDCLGSDRASVSYADSIWHFLSTSTVDFGFLTWSAAMLGRAYASTGNRPRIQEVEELGAQRRRGLSREGVYDSQYEIAQRLAGMVGMPNRHQAGLADWTLRNILYIFNNDAEQAIAFEQMLPPLLASAFTEGAFGYETLASSETMSTPIDRNELRHVLRLDQAIGDEEWLRTLAISLCRWGEHSAILPALPVILRSVSGLPAQLLPAIIHILLVEEIDKELTIRVFLSSCMASHFKADAAAPKSRQRFLLDVLLYLRTQPFPGEATPVDRLQWLDVDLLLAAEAANRCEMPTAALFLAESIAPTPSSNRRTSSRVSLSQLTPIEIPDDLLLSIFKQVEEPDAYYGVQQKASLDAVLGKFDYEQDGFKSLMFRSAQMDSAMRLAHRPTGLGSTGLMHSLSALNLHSLEYALLSASNGNAPRSSHETLETARRLQQWDVASPEVPSGSESIFSAMQELSRNSERAFVGASLKALIGRHVEAQLKRSQCAFPTLDWCSTLAALTEIKDTLDSSTDQVIRSCWQTMLSRGDWMREKSFDQCSVIATNRATLFSVLAQNGKLLQSMHISPRVSKILEVEALLQTSRLAREHGVLQEALSASTQVSQLASRYNDAGLKINAATDFETAMVLWGAGEATASVQILRHLSSRPTHESDDVKVGHAGVLAELARQLAHARMEKPEEILETCLKPAVKSLGSRGEGSEAGKVFHEYATFCDQQLQNPGSVEDYNRIASVRQKRHDEIRELQSLHRKKAGHQRDEVKQSLSKAQQWFELDDEEYQRLKRSRDAYVQLSLQNYLRALRASDDHNIDVLRFFALWLENSESQAANEVVQKHLPSVPSWKFVVLNNQLMSRLEGEQTGFQDCLKHLVTRMCAEHPFHCLHHLFAAARTPVNTGDLAANSRCRAAKAISNTLLTSQQSKSVTRHTFDADRMYDVFARSEPDTSKSKMAYKEFPPAVKMTSQIQGQKVPPATISLALRPDGNYQNVPIVVKWESTMLVMGGLSHPKVLTAQASDGTRHKQLFKYNDDLRQDAIMEQVFEEVSKMLRHHKQARQRNLHVRTYKVIPLAAKSGILEWVQNTIPIGNWLGPAHQRYYPGSMQASKASAAIRSAQSLGNDARVKEFRRVCDQLPPVLRHFFFEKFTDPDEWFERRTAYTRTTATISILGYVLGLGDRHCQNILLDEKSGEAVHIDLGVAFEAGRVLPVPETVPFRLSRDIVDGMGVSKTEGVFRRCCEFTMEALREDKDSIMTLLNVLRYDPLYNWSLSPLRAKRMQDAHETGRNAGADGDEPSSKRKEQEAGEADRALATVEKKLSKTLSTAATVNELIQQATDERNLALLFAGWSAYY